MRQIYGLLLGFKLGHCEIQIRPQGVKTGQYPPPVENRARNENFLRTWQCACRFRRAGAVGVVEPHAATVAVFEVDRQVQACGSRRYVPGLVCSDAEIKATVGEDMRFADRRRRGIGKAATRGRCAGGRRPPEPKNV